MKKHLKIKLCLSATLVGMLSLSTDANAAITFVFSPGASPDEITFEVSGGDVWNGGPVGSIDDQETRLPKADGSASWQYTDSSPWDTVVPFSVDIGIVQLNSGSTFEMAVDGDPVTNTGGVISGNDLRIDGDGPGDFSIRLPASIPPAPSVLWQYPALSGGELISWSGSGSFNVPGGLSANMNLGTYSYSDSGGIAFEAMVIPEPSSALLAAFGALAICLVRRRSMGGSRR